MKTVAQVANFVAPLIEGAVGLLKPGQDERKFWEQQREAVYAAWKRPLPIKAAGVAT